MDCAVNTKSELKRNRSDIIVKLKNIKRLLMNVATPQDYNKVTKEDEKVAKYLNLASAICMNNISKLRLYLS